jgi:hypothetical protein
VETPVKSTLDNLNRQSQSTTDNLNRQSTITEIGKHQSTISNRSMAIQQLDDQLRRYQDLARRAADLRSYL